ncbi:MAG TPA: ubiquinol-cytochrome C chaperone family protein [Stellaceae bacterium]|nr:ubiquinol-cytochrome C chaperone family protein [Stellaceae bacterium]
MVFKRLFGRDPQRQAAHKAYMALVDQARSPEFYLRHGVPDSLDGRFEMIAVHLFLVLHRLKREPGALPFRQMLFDLMFGDMDRSLREMGTGDFGVGKQVKRMAEGFYGRIAAYDPGLAGDPSRLEEGLRRNVFGTVEPDPADVAFLAAYMERQMRVLAEQDTASVMAGDLRFEPVALSPVPA